MAIMNEPEPKRIVPRYTEEPEPFKRVFDIDVEKSETNKPEPVTQLLEKNMAPMIIRKYQGYGWPLFVALICDQDLSDLDDVVMGYLKQCDPKQMNNIQDLRNFCGNLSDGIVNFYNQYKFGCVEGVGVIAYWDKCLCSSLYGDHMTHGQCRVELFTLLNMMTNM